MTAPTLSNVARPRAMGYDLALDERLFRLAAGFGQPLTIETAPTEAPRIDTSSSPEEIVTEFDRAFARSSFDGGEGLFRAHVEGAPPNRFWASKGVSVNPADPGEFPEIRLLHTTSNIELSTDTGLRLARAGDSLYMPEAQTLRRTDDPTATAPTWVNDDPHAGETATDVEDVVALGDEVYAALGTNGIHRKQASWAHWSDVEAVRVWSVKGRIVASDGQSLYEVVSGGAAPSPLKTLAPGETWQDVADGGSHVLAAASDGYVYAFSTDTGSLVLTAQTIFEGEAPRALGQTQGVIGVATSSGNVGRFWVGGVAPDSGQIADLQLVRQWGDAGTATDQAPRRVVGTRDAMYVGVTDGTDTSLWRYDVATGGLARHLTIEDVAGLVRGLASIGGRLMFTVDGAGVYRETELYEDSGYLIGPLGDFHSATEKSWIGARLETGDLPEDASVELYYTTDPDALNDPDSSSWVRVITRAPGDNETEHPLVNVVSRSLAGMVRLSANDARDETPAVRSFSFRAYSSSGEGDVIVTLPVNISDRIERRGRHRVTVRGLGADAYEALKEFEGRPTLLTLYKPVERVRGLVESVGVPVQQPTKRGSATTVAVVRVRGRRVSSSTTITGSGAFATRHRFATPPKFGAKL